MNESTKKIFSDELEKLKNDLIDKHNELKMRASGDWEQTLEVEVKQSTGGLKGIIKGLDYSTYMQRGRAGGAMPPLQAIEQWIINKGLKPLEDKMKTSSLAFLIARKIAREGTKRFQAGGTPPFIEAVITPERVQQIVDKVGYEYLSAITSDILNLFDNFKK